jgi:hypothetical protein
MIWFFPDDREWFEYRPIHISYKGIVALWKNARTPPPPMAEAVFYRGAYRIRVRMVTGRVESKEAEFAVFKVGHKEARLVLNRYWLPKDLFHDGMNECLDIFLTSKDQWEKSDIVVLFKEIAERFPSDFVNLEIRRSPWFPDLGRFPLWFPFVDDKFEPPMERDHKVGGIRCEGTPDGVNCQGIP